MVLHFLSYIPNPLPRRHADVLNSKYITTSSLKNTLFLPNPAVCNAGQTHRINLPDYERFSVVGQHLLTGCDGTPCIVFIQVGTPRRKAEAMKTIILW